MDDYEHILKKLGYCSVAQEVDKDAEIHTYLHMRVEESLADEVVKEESGHVKGGANFRVANIEAEIDKNVQRTLNS